MEQCGPETQPNTNEGLVHYEGKILIPYFILQSLLGKMFLSPVFTQYTKINCGWL